MAKPRSERTVWVNPGETQLRIATRSAPERDFGWAAHISELPGISATDLRSALIDGERSAYNSRLLVTTDDPKWLNEDTLNNVSAVQFITLPRFDRRTLRPELYLSLQAFFDEWIDDEIELHQKILALVGNFLEVSRCRLFSVQYERNYAVGSPPHLLSILLEPSTRNRTVENLHNVGLGVIELVEAVGNDGDLLTRAGLLHVLRAGRADVLVGQPEGPWFDVKQQLYDLKSVAGKISLAQAVARFANSSDGGVIVFGMATRKVGSGEVVSAVFPVAVDGQTARRHRQALELHLYPLPTGLTIEVVKTSNGKLLVVSLPPQPETAKPYLVHGAIVAGKVEGSFISIVRRSGEDSVPIQAPAVHALMSANRLFDMIKAQLLAAEGAPSVTPVEE